jgi:hypothetical protein
MIDGGKRGNDARALAKRLHTQHGPVGSALPEELQG